MGHMVVGRIVVTGQIAVTHLEMADCWTLQIGEGIYTYNIIVLVLTGMMINIIIIRIGRLIRDTF